MICFIYDLHHQHHDRRRLLEKPAELRRQHPDLPDLRSSVALACRVNRPGRRDGRVLRVGLADAASGNPDADVPPTVGRRVEDADWRPGNCHCANDLEGRPFWRRTNVGHPPLPHHVRPDM